MHDQQFLEVQSRVCCFFVFIFPPYFYVQWEGFPFVSAVCKIVAFEGEKVVKAEVRLTLHPPGTLPAHHAARPVWIPGPGSFHCGTAGGRSRRAAYTEDSDYVNSYTKNEFSAFNQTSFFAPVYKQLRKCNH